MLTIALVSSMQYSLDIGSLLHYNCRYCATRLYNACNMTLDVSEVIVCSNVNKKGARQSMANWFM